MGKGPPYVWDQGGPRLMGVGGFFALGPPRSQSEGGHRFHAVRASAVPKRRRPRRPRSGGPGGPKARGNLRRFGTTEAPAAWARGPPMFGTTAAPASWA